MIAAVAMMLAQPPAQDPNLWKYLATSTSGEKWYLQNRPPIRDAQYTVTWLLVDLSGVRTSRVRTRIARLNINCEDEAFQVPQSTEYGPDGTSLSVRIYGYSYIAPGSFMELVLRATCPAK